MSCFYWVVGTVNRRIIIVLWRCLTRLPKQYQAMVDNGCMIHHSWGWWNVMNIQQHFDLRVPGLSTSVFWKPTGRLISLDLLWLQACLNPSGEIADMQRGGETEKGAWIPWAIMGFRDMMGPFQIQNESKWSITHTCTHKATHIYIYIILIIDMILCYVYYCVLVKTIRHVKETDRGFGRATEPSCHSASHDAPVSRFLIAARLEWSAGCSDFQRIAVDMICTCSKYTW